MQKLFFDLSSSNDWHQREREREREKINSIVRNVFCCEIFDIIQFARRCIYFKISNAKRNNFFCKKVFDLRIGKI